MLLQRSLRVRNPYVDVLNVIQVEALERLRSNTTSGDDTEPLGDTERAVLQDILLISINGVAAGLRNSG